MERTEKSGAARRRGALTYFLEIDGPQGVTGLKARLETRRIKERTARSFVVPFKLLVYGKTPPRRNIGERGNAVTEF